MLHLNPSVLFFLLNPQGNSPIANVPDQVWYRSARNSALEAGGVEQRVLCGGVLTLLYF